MHPLTVDQLRPMEAPSGSNRPFTDPDWLYEIKFDGYRCLAGCGSGQVTQLRTRSGADCTKWYPEVADALATLRGARHVIDGEACVLDDIGRSDFERLQARARRRRRYPGSDQVTLCAFDLLVHDGRDVMSLPLIERKALLAQLLAGVPKQCVLYVGDFPADAALFDQVVMPLQLEGLMAKRKASIYRPAQRTYDWRKIKRPGWEDGRRWVNAR